jgi:hypothetical protein
MRKSIALFVGATALVAGCGGGGSKSSDTKTGVTKVPATQTTAQTSSAPPNPARFAHQKENPWFPLRPGSTYTYSGVKDGKPSRDVFKVTGATRMIQGVRCIAVDDRLYLRGKLGERTTDYYASDAQGNVWYFGENTAELDAKGKVTSTEGTWLSGVKGAQAGVYITADPRVGQSMRQEYFKGHAEDHFRVAKLGVQVKTPAVSSKSALLTEEFTPVEPGVLDHKVYVRGIGNVLEVTVKGPQERNTLVSYHLG